MSPYRPVVAIVGPTASGKTALSIEVARALDGEIISMDSRQVYRGMNIGTAKATSKQRAAVPHHGLDLVTPEQRFNAGSFARYARQTISEIQGRGKLPILVGGTGFFLRALTHPIFQEPPLDRGRRTALASYLEGLDDERRREWLCELDPESAARLSSWGGRQRVLRALEIVLLTGRPISWWHANSPPSDPPLEPLVFVLDLPRERLRAAIDARVGDMVREGLLEEVSRLLAAGFDERSPGMNATGYIELIPYYRGEIAIGDALETIRRNTWAYARRQLTWLRNQLPDGAVWLDASQPREELVETIVAAIRRTPSLPADVEGANLKEYS